jgi:hypothetical protein
VIERRLGEIREFKKETLQYHNKTIQHVALNYSYNAVNVYKFHVIVPFIMVDFNSRITILSRLQE